MEMVLVTRAFAEPVTFASIQAREDAGAWCLEANDVHFRKTLFSRDRRRMVCVYRAPDAEAVRRAQRGAEMPFDAVWSCREVWTEGEGMGPDPGNLIVVERQLEVPAAPAEVAERVRAKQWCFEQYGVVHRVAYISPGGHEVVCVFQGPDAESVRLSNRTAEMPVVRAWPATLHAPPAAQG